MREQEPTGSAARAARLIYLNRTCWNSLYRVNRQGKFNVPIGSKNEVFLPTDNFEATSLALRSAKLVCSDFEPVLDETSSGDLVFADPPYTVSHGNNGFIKYNENLFSWEDQVRLAKSATAAVTRGAMVLVTNVFQAQVRELYQKSFVFMKLSRYSRMAADVLARKACDELVAISRNMHEELRDAGILS